MRARCEYQNLSTRNSKISNWTRVTCWCAGRATRNELCHWENRRRTRSQIISRISVLCWQRGREVELRQAGLPGLEIQRCFLSGVAAASSPVNVYGRWCVLHPPLEDVLRLHICCAIPAPRIWLRMVPTFEPCRSFWATQTFPRRRSIHTWRSTGYGRCIRSIIRGRRRDETHLGDTGSTQSSFAHAYVFRENVLNSMTATGRAKTIVGKAVTDFLRHLSERNSSPHTIKAYRRDLSLFAAYAGSCGWKQIDHIAVRGFLSQLYGNGLSKTSVARALAAVRSLYRWLAREGGVEHNPAKLGSMQC